MAAVMVSPGAIVPVSGQYKHSCGAAGQTTLVKGNHASPTHGSGDVWVLVRATPHV
jgi:hypothetical protein